MECSMQIDCDLDEPCEIIKQVKISARLPHVCQECGRSILVGEIYERYVGKSDGEIFTHKTCLTCLSVRDVFSQNFWFGGLWEELENELNETNGQVPEACLRELTKEARKKVCERIEEYWKEHFDEDED